ncbi:MAG: hypothetical protein ISS36_02960 [Candidatus Aenigmarchaeota archaeon]|nr:hypothetical protein [Candidatus Aenigmarchaeota archaeon]
MFKRLLLLICLFTVLVGANPALAISNIDLQITPQTIEVCPDRTITDDDIKITVKNLLSRSDTFTLSVDWITNSDSAFINPEIVLASNEIKEVETFWINVPYTIEPGTYTATIRAVSRSTGHSVSKTISVKVLGCHLLEIAGETSKDVCRETELPVTYSLLFKNLGKYTETFDFCCPLGSTDITSGLTFSQNSVTVSSGSTKTVTMTLNPPKTLSGLHTLEIFAVSRNSYAEATKKVSLNLKQCYNFNAEITPSQISDACLGRSFNHTLTIRNTGSKEDTYIVSGPSWASSVGSVTVPAGSIRSVSLTSRPQKTGSNTLELTVTSTTNPNMAKKVSSSIQAKECKDAILMVSPVQNNICKKEKGEFSVTVKNTGTLQDTFTVSTTLGTLSKDKVILDPDQVEVINLNIDTEGLVGTKTITVRATDGSITKQASAVLAVENCYDGELVVNPESISACPFTGVNFTANVRNTGTRSDTFSIGFVYDGKTNPEFTNITLAPGVSKNFDFSLSIANEEGLKRLDVFATSQYTSMTTSTPVSIKSINACYSASIRPDKDNVDIRTSKATLIPVTVRNTGDVAQTYNLGVDGPEWVFLRPNTLHLRPDEEEKTYIYISPIYYTLEGDYVVTLSANTARSQTTAKVKVSVKSNITGPLVTSDTGRVCGERGLVDCDETAQQQPIVTEPNITTPEPNITTPEPNITTPEPNITTPEPNITTPEPNVTEPNITESEDNGTNITLDATFDNITGLILEDIEERPFWKIAAIVIITLIIIVILIIRFALLVK